MTGNLINIWVCVLVMCIAVMISSFVVEYYKCTLVFCFIIEHNVCLLVQPLSQIKLLTFCSIFDAKVKHSDACFESKVD